MLAAPNVPEEMPGSEDRRDRPNEVVGRRADRRGRVHNRAEGKLAEQTATDEKGGN